MKQFSRNKQNQKLKVRPTYPSVNCVHFSVEKAVPFVAPRCEAEVCIFSFHMFVNKCNSTQQRIVDGSKNKYRSFIVELNVNNSGQKRSMPPVRSMAVMRYAAPGTGGSTLAPVRRRSLPFESPVRRAPGTGELSYKLSQIIQFFPPSSP